MTPISAFAESLEYVGPVLIIDWQFRSSDGVPVALCVNDEGRGVMVWLKDLRMDFRYDWDTHSWVDVNGVTDDAPEDHPPDGGEEVP